MFARVVAKANLVLWSSVAASLGLFVASLFLPAFHLEREEPVRGIWLLVWGWCGVFTLNFAWFANPCYLAALICAVAGGRSRLAQVLLVCALALGVLAVFTQVWYTNIPVKVVRMGSAFYVWMAAFCALLLGLTFTRALASAAS